MLKIIVNCEDYVPIAHTIQTTPVATHNMYIVTGLVAKIQHLAFTQLFDIINDSPRFMHANNALI